MGGESECRLLSLGPLYVREPVVHEPVGPGRLPEVWCAPGVTGVVAGAGARPARPAQELSLLRGAVDLVTGRPVSGRAVDVAEVLTLVERLRGVALRQLGELDASRGYLEDGRASAAVWLKHQQVIGEDSARSAVVLARRLREDLDQLGQQLLDGRTTAEHVRAAAAGTAGLDPALVAQAQPGIADLLAVAEPAVVRRQLRDRAHAIDPQLGRDAARRQHARRGFYAGAVGGAGVVLGGTLDDEGGAELLLALDLQVQADRSAADPRTLPARRADALVGWARRAAMDLAGPGDSLADDAHTVRSSLLVACTADQLRAAAHQQAVAQLDALVQPDRPVQVVDPLAVLSGHIPVRPAAFSTGATLLPEQLRRLACDSTLTLVLQELHDQQHTQLPVRVEPLYVGRSARTISGRQFKALVLRDRQCVVRGCAEPPARCAGHHVRHWLDGGPTDLDNLVLLCHRHHHDHHDRGHDLPHHDGRWLTHAGWGTDPPSP